MQDTLLEKTPKFLIKHLQELYRKQKKLSFSKGNSFPTASMAECSGITCPLKLVLENKSHMERNPSVSKPKMLESNSNNVHWML